MDNSEANGGSENPFVRVNAVFVVLIRLTNIYLPPNPGVKL